MRALLFIAVATLSALVLPACRGMESEQPPLHLIHNMDTQEKGRPYRRDTSGLFADGRVMRAPVEGTVAQGHLDDDDHLFLGLEGKDAAQKFPDAVKVDGKVPESLRERGKSRYQIYCAPCHGALGDGKGTVADKALDGGPRLTVPPPSFHDARLKEMVVGKYFAAMTVGVNAGNMPSYSSQLVASDRWAVIAYLRTLQRERDPSVADEGGEVIKVVGGTTSTLEMGQQLYKAKGCNACHSLDGVRLVGPSFKGLWGKTEKTTTGEVVVDEAYVKESVLTPMAKVVDGYPPAMPPQALTDVELGSIVLFMKEQK